MDELNDTLEPRKGPAIPPEPAPPIRSRFLFVDVAALRAKQLRRGAQPRLETADASLLKAERLAMEEVRHGLVYYAVSHSDLSSREGGPSTNSGSSRVSSTGDA